MPVERYDDGLDDIGNDEELLDEEGEPVGVGGPGINSRVWAARLAAGYLLQREAARALGLHEATFRHAESGLRGVTAALLEAAIATYGVSRDFLLEGAVSTAQDALAERLAAVLAKARDKPDDFADRAERLKEIRTELGFANPKRFAEEYGWPISSYYAHEIGARGVTIDRMVGYCFLLGARPEFGILGERPVLEPQKVDWKELRGDGAEVTAAAGQAGP